VLLIDTAVGAFLAHDLPRLPRVTRSYVREAPPCRDWLAGLLARAGWTGEDNRTAWAIVMRESNGRPDVGTGGLFQLKASVWAGTDIWPSNINDATQNAAAAHKLWQRAGWRPWGITHNGHGIDSRDYGAWDAATQWAWIWKPYATWRAAYPCEVTP
jgi:hypothetical protein